MLSLQKATLFSPKHHTGLLEGSLCHRKSSLLRFVDQRKRSSFYFLAGKKESKMASRKDKESCFEIRGGGRQDRPWTTSQKPYFRCLHSTSTCAKPPSRMHISLKSPKYKEPFKKHVLSQTPAGLVA